MAGSGAAEAGAGVDIISVAVYFYAAALLLLLLVVDPNLLVGPKGLDNFATAALPLALVAVGQSLAVFTKGMDLSVGGIISLLTVILATHGTFGGLGLVAELIAVIALGAFLGAVSGFVIAATKLQPFIVTLATWSIWDGVAAVILPQPGGNPAPALTSWFGGDVLGIPKSVCGLALLYLAWLWARRTTFVVDLWAIGSDEQSARLLGVKVGLRRVQAYAVTGLLAALAAIWVTAQTGSGSPTAGDQFILNSVAAVVIGGSSLVGGSGSAGRSIVGALVLMLVPDVIFGLQLASFWSVFLQGALLVFAVSVSAAGAKLQGRGGV